MDLPKKWTYDYDARCECSDDDRCGCTFPGNMARSFVPDYTVKPETNGNSLVGQKAINFIAPAVFADGTASEAFNFFDYVSDSYALLMFYLADFSAVCPMEITSFNQAHNEFVNRGVKVAAVSVDSLPAHIAWRKLSFSEGGIGQVNMPLISDLNKNISTQYGVLRPDGMSQRAMFLIDRSFNVRYQAVYDRKLERNVEETLRVIDNLLVIDKAECQDFQCQNAKITENALKPTGQP